MKQLQRPAPTGTRATTPDHGDRPDFDAFFAHERQRAVRLAWLLTRSESAAEDVAQDAFVAVHARFAQLDCPEAYLSRVVVNLSRRWHRGRRRDLDLAGALRTTAGADVLTAPPAGDYLLDAVYRLPFRQRAVVVGRYWADWSEADIARALGCRPGTVKSLASRALAQLRKEIER